MSTGGSILFFLCLFSEIKVSEASFFLSFQIVYYDNYRHNHAFPIISHNVFSTLAINVLIFGKLKAGDYYQHTEQQPETTDAVLLLHHPDHHDAGQSVSDAEHTGVTYHHCQLQ
jgi:hypothetical protein